MIPKKGHLRGSLSRCCAYADHKCNSKRNCPLSTARWLIRPFKGRTFADLIHALRRPTCAEICTRLQTLVQEHAAVVSVAAQAVTKVSVTPCLKLAVCDFMRLRNTDWVSQSARALDMWWYCSAALSLSLPG